MIILCQLPDLFIEAWNVCSGVTVNCCDITSINCDINLFATRPVAATGFQTTAAYYTLRGDGLHGSQMYAVYEPIIVHIKYLLKSANNLHDISLSSSKN